MASREARKAAIERAARLVRESGCGWVKRATPSSKVKPAFTGICPVREHTADGAYVGPCEYPTYCGRCHRHGDVSRWLVPGADLSAADDRLIATPTEKERRG